MNIPKSEAITISFYEDIYKPCVAKCSESNLDSNSMWRKLNRGTEILNNREECDWYIALYGAHHFHKLNAAFESTKFTNTNGKNLEIIDWGCGQALATCVLIDYLLAKSINPHIVSITLIEPSRIALERGCCFISQMNNFPSQPQILRINKYINDLECSDLASNADTLKIHLFSNIIDIESVNLDKLYNLIVRSYKGVNRFICTSPNGQDRLNKFYQLFQQSFSTKNYYQSDTPIDREYFRFETKQYGTYQISRQEYQFTVHLS